jgi:hypothetical protein
VKNDVERMPCLRVEREREREREREEMVKIETFV